MPIYEYCCPNCQAKFELLRPVSRADEEALCPQCHIPAKRALSTFAAFSKSSSGMSTPISGAAGACGTCSASSCGTCGS